MTPITRQEEIRDLWKQYQGLYVLAGILIGLLLFPFLELIINDLSQLLIGLVPEAIGIGFTVFFLDRINEYRRKQEQIEELKIRLIRDAGSKVNDVAIKAIEELREYGWLKGDHGLLKKANLQFANLEGAYLQGANLEGANLFRTNLSGASLREANLKNIMWEKEKDGKVDSDLSSPQFMKTSV